jgi:ABC-type multidrug transport system fused ATPase/permease subunit
MPLSRRFGGSFTRPPALPQRLSGVGLIWWIFRSQPGRSFGAMAVGAIWMSTLVLTPVALGQVIDRGVAERDWQQFALWATAVFLLGMINAGLWIVRHQLTTGNGRRALGWLELHLGDRILDERGGLDHRAPGEFVSLVGSDARQIARFVEATSRGAAAIVNFIVVVTAMLFIEPLLALVILGLLLPFLVLVVIAVRALEKHSHGQQTALAQAASLAGDAITGLRIVRGIGGTVEMGRRYAKASDTVERRGLRATRMQALSASLGVAMPGAVVALVGWYGGSLAANGDLTTGELVTFSGWAVFLVVPLRTFDELARRFAVAHAGSRRIAAVLSAPLDLPVAEESRDVTVDVRQEPVTVELELVNVPVNGLTTPVTEVFADGALTVVRADHHVTDDLVALMSRARDAVGGSIRLGGSDFRDLPLSELRARVLVAEHDAMLFHGSLRYNLAVGRADASDRAMYDALHAAAAMDIVRSLDDGLDGVVSERGRSLSGGQRQRVALARALLADPTVLVLVDPTSAVDAYTESEIVDRVRSARSGKTTIVITTSPAFARCADVVIDLVAAGSKGVGA